MGDAMGSEHLVLIADDDHSIREILAELLEDEGYEVLVASDGDVAISLLERATPCIVLLDLMMPRISGWEVFEHMQSIERLRRIPVCILSAIPDKAPPGVTCVMGKPLRVDALLRVLDTHC